MKRFRISKHDMVKAHIFNKDGKLLTTLYDSGFTTIDQIKTTLRGKVNGYNKTSISISNEDKQTYWSNR